MRAAFQDPAVRAIMFSQLVISTALFYLFPAMVLEWRAEFGWSLGQLMGAFSVALGVQGLSFRTTGRWIDRGQGAAVMAGGALIAVVGLALLTQVTALWQFYLIWAMLGLAMAMTLYDAVFALLIRSRGAAAQGPITLVALGAGLASSAAFTSTAVLSAMWGWRGAVICLAGLVLFVHLPLITFATRRLQRDGAYQPEPGGSVPIQTPGGPGPWMLSMAISFSALGIGMIFSHLMPLLRWLELEPAQVVLAASLVGPAQIAGRLAIGFSLTGWPRLHLAVGGLVGLAAAPILLLLSALGPSSAFAFAAVFGICYGISSVLRPMVIREVLGQGGFGRSQGAVLGPAFVAFGAAPYLAAILVEATGYLGVLILFSGSQTAGAWLLQRSRPALPRPA